MKIAFVNDAIYPYTKGGVEKRIDELARRLVARGDEVHLFGLKWWDGPDIRREGDLIFHGVGGSREFYVDGRRSISEALYFSRRVLLPLLREEFDVVDCQASPYFHCFSSRAAAFVRREPFLITWHEVWNEYWYTYLGRKGAAGRWVELGVARLPSQHAAVSQSTLNCLRRLGVTGPIPIIPNGISFSQITSLAPSTCESDLVFAGRLIREKQVHLLIEAVALLVRDQPDLRCLIIGDGPEMPALQALVRDRKLERNVRFVGFVAAYEDLIALLRASKVFVLPSVREGFGIVVIEAMAAGLPVVTVEHPMNAAKDLIDGSNGRVCALSAESIAEASRELLSLSGGATEDCIAFAATYDWDRVTETLLEVFHGLQM